MALRALSTVLVQQAVVTGRVMDALTQERLAVPASLLLELRETGTPEYRRFSNPVRFSGNGYFVFYGQPESVFPNLDPASSLEFRLSARARGYADRQVVFTLAAPAVTPTQSDETLAGAQVRVTRLNAPVAEQDLAMTPNPVSLAGKVIQDHDLDNPVADASVSVTAPQSRGPVTTDVRGYFRIDDLPVAPVVTLQVETGASSVSVDHRINYNTPMNELTVSLSA